LSAGREAKFDPVIVTVAPGAAAAGLNPVIIGGAPSTDAVTKHNATILMVQYRFWICFIFLVLEFTPLRACQRGVLSRFGQMKNCIGLRWGCD
jgi:hypothetical protein